MSFTWNWNYLWTGVSVIASGITIWQAWSVRNAKKEVEKVRNQIHIYIFGNELSELVKEGTDVKQKMSPLVATNINEKTTRGLNKDEILSSAITFISNCKVKTSLVETKKQEITTLYENALNPIQEKNYPEIHKILTGLLEILEEERKKRI